jgi:AAA domain
LENTQSCATAIGSELAKARANLEASQATLTEARDVQAKTNAANALIRVWRGLPRPEVQTAIVQGLEKRMQEEYGIISQIERTFNQATAMVREITELEQKLSPYCNVPRADAMTQSVESLTAELNKSREFLSTLRNCRETAQEKHAGILNLLAAFQARHGMTPQDALSKAEVLEQRYSEATHALKAADAERVSVRFVLEDQFGRWLRAVRLWGLTAENPVGLREIFSAIKDAQELAFFRLKDLDAMAVGAEIARLNSQATHVIRHIASIEEQIAVLAVKLIANASVLAVTLATAYLRDTIQARRFDTVILDEASMAPIPALWVVASLATANVVAVGDFKQLPPIVLSGDDMAQKWLGRDIFEAAGISSGDKLLQTPPDYFVRLLEQRRMHPEIRRIPNELIYDGQLYDHTPTMTDETELRTWYRSDWGHDAPVLLVDTGSTEAWVTSVSKGASSSRLNYLSATVCVDLAEKLFREGGADNGEQSKRRVIIICPYAPHAKLLRLLIRHQGLGKRVEAGTVHSFQGSEADVVIFDMVNDEPHWKVGLFNPANDNNNRRLINVALTRAKRRLFIVGDFDYCEKLSRKAFLGGTFIPFLRAHYAKVDALQVIPPGLAARAAGVAAFFSQ